MIEYIPIMTTMMNQKKQSRSQIPMLALIMALSFFICGGSDVRAWTKAHHNPRKIALDRTANRVTPTLLASIPQNLENIPRGGDNPIEPPPGIEIMGESLVYSGWRKILKRTVKMRNGKVCDFDLVGVKTGEGAVLVFAWDTKTKTATMIREYMPASNKILWGLAAGLIEDKHGQNTETAARHELEEECHLKGGTWIPLLTKPAQMDKYALTAIQCYLVIDPEPETNPKPLDEEEDIEIVSGVTIPEIMGYIRDGEMNLVGGYGSLLAIEKLRELGEYP